MTLPDINFQMLSLDNRYAGMLVREDAHEGYEFVYYFSCRGELYIENRRYDIEPGRFCVIRPGIRHRELHSSDGVVFYVIFQCGVELSNMFGGDDQSGTLLDICKKLVSEYRCRDDFSGQLIALHMKELLLRLMRLDVRSHNKLFSLEDAKEYIGRNCAEHIDFGGLAESAGYSIDYFHRLFRKCFGISPKQYQIDCRLKRAETLLGLGDYSCTEIAYLCGFSNAAQFTQLFRRSHGAPPLKWRERAPAGLLPPHE